MSRRIWGHTSVSLLIRNLDKNLVINVLRWLKVNIGDSCDIETGLVFHNCTDFTRLIIGSGTHIGKNCFIDLRNKVEIGSNCTISMGTTILTHEDMGKSTLSAIYPPQDKPVYINNDVYIGANSTILMATEIGACSIVAAGSLVKGNVEANSVYAGIPARRVKSINKLGK